MGEGANGRVISANDNQTQQQVAIKKLSNPFLTKIGATRTLREVKLLKYFKHENVLQITDILPGKSCEQLEDVYIATELMESDLAEVVAGGHVLEPDQLSYIFYQVLRGLLYIHSANVIHRDIKPGNILINSECDVKICDFGMARVAKQSQNSLDSEAAREMTEYVATRWYRAPEIMLSWTEYTSAVDVWSVGCVMAEMLLLKPLFAGRDYLHQLELIVSVVGTPDDLSGISSEHALKFMKSLPVASKADMQTIVCNGSPELIHLLDRMLAFSPQERITIQEALKLPYFTHLHDPNDEPKAKQLFTWDFEETEMCCDELKHLFWKEMLEMHPEVGHLEEEEFFATSDEDVPPGSPHMHASEAELI